MINIISYPENN